MSLRIQEPVRKPLRFYDATDMLGSILLTLPIGFFGGFTLAIILGV